jgi:arginase
MPRYSILEAPSVLGQIPTQPGVGRLPEALLQAGLADRLMARRAGRVESPAYSAERDSDTNLLNPRAINDYSRSLADAVGSVLDNGDFPVVLGGDCSILLGTMLALKRRGRYGLLYIDGHSDFYPPESNPAGGAVSASDLAFATGRGPDVVANIEGHGPLVRDDDVVVFAYRDGVAQVRNRCQPLPTGSLALDRDQVRRLGVSTAAREAVTFLTREGGAGEGFWIHLDADVLDDSIMWAVDDPRPNGLLWDDLAATLRIAVGSGCAVGLQVTIYNPDMESDGVSGRGLAAIVGDTLAEFLDV